jgi:hypothetical protein
VRSSTGAVIRAPSLHKCSATHRIPPPPPPARFSNLLLVASDPSVSPATTGGISDWVNVTVSSITYLRADGSEILVGNGTVMGNAASYSGGTCNNALTRSVSQNRTPASA